MKRVLVLLLFPLLHQLIPLARIFLLILPLIIPLIFSTILPLVFKLILQLILLSSPHLTLVLTRIMFLLTRTKTISLRTDRNLTFGTRTMSSGSVYIPSCYSYHNDRNWSGREEIDCSVKIKRYHRCRRSFILQQEILVEAQADAAKNYWQKRGKPLGCSWAPSDFISF